MSIRSDGSTIRLDSSNYGGQTLHRISPLARAVISGFGQDGDKEFSRLLRRCPSRVRSTIGTLRSSFEGFESEPGTRGNSSGCTSQVRRAACPSGARSFQHLSFAFYAAARGTSEIAKYLADPTPRCPPSTDQTLKLSATPAFFSPKRPRR
jgi:hypothetical protein